MKGNENKGYFSLIGDFSKKDNLKKVVLKLKHEYKTVSVNFLEEYEKNALVDLFGNEIIKINTDENQSDYFYKISDFVNLSGKKSQHKRAGYNNFIKNDYFYRELSKDDKDICLKITDKWCERKDCTDCEYCCERETIKHLFENWNEFPVKGGIIYVDNTAQAFLICEVNGNIVYGYHQKTASAKIPGLSYGIYIEAMKNTFSDYEYFNFGPDLGIQGLRQFKHQFKPYELINKYSVTL